MVRAAQHLERDLSAYERAKIQRLSTGIIKEYLDRGAGACHLRKPGWDAPTTAGEDAGATR
jgi:hypothetical protein